MEEMDPNMYGMEDMGDMGEMMGDDGEMQYDEEEMGDMGEPGMLDDDGMGDFVYGEEVSNASEI